MLAVAEIIRLHGAAYRAHVGAVCSPVRRESSGILRRAGLRPSVATSRSVITASGRSIAITRAAIAMARRVTTRTPNAGSRRSACSSCRARIIS